MNQPVQLAGRRRAGILAAVQQGLAQPVPPRISIRAQKFTLVDAAGVQIPVQMFDPNYGLYLDVVMIGANQTKSKVYYEFDYDPTKDDAPTCFSDNGVGPSSQSAKPQASTCEACPNNVWGSDTSKMTGKPTKACSDRKKLAVLVVNDPARLVYQLQIPPASLKNLAVFVNALGSHQITDAEGPRQVDPGDVVTRLYWNPQKQGELMFQPMGFQQQLVPGLDALIDQVDATGAIDAAVCANDVPFTGAIAGPQPVQMLAAPAPMPQMQAPPPAAPQQFQQPAPLPPQYVPARQISEAVPLPFQQPQGQNGAALPAPPAPRSRRGGARAGAGRPTQEQAPAPTAAPFQQQAPATQQFQQPAPTTTQFQQPAPAPQFQQAAPGPVPFQPVAAQPFTGPVPSTAQPMPNPNAGLGIPAFLQRQQPAPAPAPQAQPQQPSPMTFGMQNGGPVPASLQQELDNAFGQPLPPRQR